MNTHLFTTMGLSNAGNDGATETGHVCDAGFAVAQPISREPSTAHKKETNTVLRPFMMHLRSEKDHGCYAIHGYIGQKKPQQVRLYTHLIVDEALLHKL